MERQEDGRQSEGRECDAASGLTLLCFERHEQRRKFVDHRCPCVGIGFNVRGGREERRALGVGSALHAADDFTASDRSWSSRIG